MQLPLSTSRQDTDIAYGELVFYKDKRMQKSPRLLAQELDALITAGVHSLGDAGGRLLGMHAHDPRLATAILARTVQGSANCELFLQHWRPLLASNMYCTPWMSLCCWGLQF